MDWNERFWADVARAIERQRIGEELVSIANRLGIGTLKQLEKKSSKGQTPTILTLIALLERLNTLFGKLKTK